MWLSLLAFGKGYWGEVIAAIFIGAWVWLTIGLYNEVGDLHAALGASDGAIDICQIGKIELDDKLIGLEDQIRDLLLENEKYVDDINAATENISDLENSLAETLNELADESVPADCSGAMDWMIEKAIQSQ